MKYLKRFILMVQFLTTIPLRFRLNVTEEDFGKGLVFAPLVGLILGGLLAAAGYLLGLVFPVYVSAVITVIFYIILTGGLHLDGLGDTFDGLFSNRSRERMLEIMRDSRVGTNAVLAVASVLLLDTALISSFGGGRALFILLLMPVAGRVGSLIGSGVSVYARKGEGLGKSFIDYCGYAEIAFGLLLYFAIFILAVGAWGVSAGAWGAAAGAWGVSAASQGAAAGLSGLPSGLPVLAAGFVPPVSALILTGLFNRKIGGATGDTLGAVCELNQTIFLLAALLIFKLC